MSPKHVVSRGGMSQGKAIGANRGESCGGRRLTITVGHLPPPELNPNNLRREHWTIRYRATKEAQEEIGWLAKVDWRDDKPMMKARISYQFHVKDHRRRDLDNLLSACKAYQDGLIEVGVLFYDDAAHLEIGSVKMIQNTEEKTVLEIEEL
jgi:Holliday junction resolvase RusA-like endonuclease